MVFNHSPVVEREALCADGGIKTSVGGHLMERRKYTHRNLNKKREGLGVLFFALLVAALTAAVMGGTFSCGMTGWSKYFC